MVCSSSQYVWLVGAAPAIKHEWTVLPACSAVDLCSSSCDLDDVEQPPTLLENSPQQGVATAQPAAAATTQEPSAAQRAGAPASVAAHPPTLTGLQPHQALRRASQAAIGAHRPCRISSQDPAKCQPLEGQSESLCMVPACRIDLRRGNAQAQSQRQTLDQPKIHVPSSHTPAMTETKHLEKHLQTPPSNTASPRCEHQKLPAPEGKGQTKQPASTGGFKTNKHSLHEEGQAGTHTT